MGGWILKSARGTHGSVSFDVGDDILVRFWHANLCGNHCLQRVFFYNCFLCLVDGHASIHSLLVWFATWGGTELGC